MKKVSLILCMLFGAILVGNAQCEEVASNFGNNDRIPSYNITGGIVTVILSADGSEVTLDLDDDFRTASGPDIRAYLINSDGLSDAQIKASEIDNLENISMGLVGSTDQGINQNGAKTFTVPVPNDKNIEDFDKVFFYCKEFDQFWDFGTFDPFTTQSCNVLDIEDKEFAAIGLTQNPVSNTINIKNPSQQELEIRIFDTIGNLVAKEQGTRIENKIDVSSLSTGAYFVQLTAGSFIKTEQLVIR